MKFRHYNGATGRIEEVDADIALVRVDLFEKLGNSDALGYRREVVMSIAELRRLLAEPTSTPKPKKVKT